MIPKVCERGHEERRRRARRARAEAASCDSATAAYLAMTNLSQRNKTARKNITAPFRDPTAPPPRGPARNNTLCLRENRIQSRTCIVERAEVTIQNYYL